MSIHKLKQLQHLFPGDVDIGILEEIHELVNGEAGGAVLIQRTERLFQSSLMILARYIFHFEDEGVLPV